MAFSNKCTCCLTREPDKYLDQNYTYFDKIENYSDMLKDCFGFNVSSENGICEICVTRLRDASSFRDQVQECQEILQKKWTECKPTKLELALGEGDNYATDRAIKLEYDDMDDDENDTFIAEIKNEPDELLVKESTTKISKKHYTKVKNRKKSNKDVLGKILKLNHITVKKEDPVGINEGLPRKISFLNPSMQVSKKSHQKKPLKLFVNKTVLDISNSVSDFGKFIQNIANLVKYSNCIPFTNRTIHGFRCAFCNHTSREKHNLRQHIDETHKTIDRFTAGKNTIAKSRTVKFDIADLKCSLCEKGMASLNDLKLHLKEHDIRMYDDVVCHIVEFKFLNDKDFRCIICNNDYETYLSLAKHMNNHFRNFICDVCDTGFINAEQLKMHTKLHEKGEFPCRHCEKPFSTTVKRDNHEKTHKKLTTKCSFCDETFSTYLSRNKHMKLVHNALPGNYICNICNKQFLLSGLLRCHVRKYHLMEKKHECTVCGKAFNRTFELSNHMVKHTGERKFKCDFCGKSYGRKFTLTEHLRIHYNDRRFKCPMCESTFVQKCSMKGHMQSNHSISWAEYQQAHRDDDKSVTENVLQ